MLASQPWPAHLHFILPSTTWLSTIADVILGTRGQAVGQELSPSHHSSPRQPALEPLGDALACSSGLCSDWERLLGAATVLGLPSLTLPHLTWGRTVRDKNAPCQLTFSYMADFWE